MNDEEHSLGQLSGAQDDRRDVEHVLRAKCREACVHRCTFCGKEVERYVLACRCCLLRVAAEACGRREYEATLVPLRRSA